MIVLALARVVGAAGRVLPHRRTLRNPPAASSARASPGGSDGGLARGHRSRLAGRRRPGARDLQRVRRRVSLRPAGAGPRPEPGGRCAWAGRQDSASVRGVPVEPWETPPEGGGGQRNPPCARRNRHALLPAAGQRVEWHREYLRWLQALDAALAAGVPCLTIDYGDELPALYHRRPAGTVRAYFQHQRLTGPEIYCPGPGRQDLTADANFTDLKRWGAVARSDGSRLLTTRRTFLRRWLPPGYLRRREHEPRVAFLLDGAGAGGAFKVLEQQRALIHQDRFRKQRRGQPRPEPDFPGDRAPAGHREHRE